MYRVEVKHWIAGSGFSHSETIDNIDVFCTAKEYVQEAFDNPDDVIMFDAVEVAILENDTILSKEWIEKE